MFDMLVRLYDLPDVTEQETKLKQQGIIVRRAGTYEMHLVASWVGKVFSPKWVSEMQIAFARMPVSCMIATKDHCVVGFACYDVTFRGAFGPMGVDPSVRGCGVGKVLLVRSLKSLHELGFAYGIIGGVGPAEFYAHTVGAVPIEGSSPGTYIDILPEPQV